MRNSFSAFKATLLMGALLQAGGSLALGQAARPAAQPHDVILQNPYLRLDYHTATGRFDIEWRNGSRLSGVVSAAQLADGRSVSSSGYARHELAPSTRTGGAQPRHAIVVRNTSPGSPALIQHLVVSGDQPWITVQAELEDPGKNVGTRHFDAVVIQGADALTIPDAPALRVLHVPFDNDMWFRFNSEPLSQIKEGTVFSSSEVTALYDNQSRHAIVLGSVTHDVWKTAIDVRAQDGAISDLDIYGGISAPGGVRSDTHDTLPHGVVHGARVLSPRIFIGAYSDWRDGLEAYGRANAAVHPPLRWAAGAPMGWNSWAAYADKIDYDRYLGAANFVHRDLLPEGFGRNKVVYINLDAFWSRLDAVQLADAVRTIKAMRGADGTRFEAGIYWTPFAYWSDNLDAWVEGTNMKYRYRDILLRAPDGSLLPKVDGGRAIDPSSPGAKERIDYFLRQFQQMGFTYLKLDFLSHGALEGRHYDPAVQTGVEAYNEGMRQIVSDTRGRIFLSLSIAPLFPSGYGNARRLSCDTKGHISGREQSTEYELNSLTYGWWTNGNLYIADPDHVVLGTRADLGARSVEEGKSRLLSAIITSGMILDSSRLADDPQGQDFARQVYNSRRWFAVADEGQAFRPIEGDTGDEAASAFVRRSAQGFYLAVFNYDDGRPQAITIPLARIDPSLASHPVTVSDVATGQALQPAGRELRVSLPAAGSKLLELQPAKQDGNEEGK